MNLVRIPEGSTIYAAKVSYYDYGIEDALKEAGITLKSVRKKNSKLFFKN